MDLSQIFRISNFEWYHIYYLSISKKGFHNHIDSPSICKNCSVINCNTSIRYLLIINRDYEFMKLKIMKIYEIKLPAKR